MPFISPLLCTVLIAIAAPNAPMPTKLEWKPKVGASHFYKVQMAMNSSTQEAGFSVSAEMKQTIEDIAKDGKVTARRRWSKFSIAIKGGADGGDPPPTPPDSTVRDVFAPNGDQIDEVPINDDGTPKKAKKAGSGSGDQGDDEGDAGATLMVPPVIYPSQEVEVGATWTDKDPDSKDKKATDKSKSSADGVTFTYAGEESALNVPCYRIDVDLQSSKQTPMTGYGHLWISKEDGTVVKERLKVKGEKQDADTPAFEMEVKVDLDD